MSAFEKQAGEKGGSGTPGKQQRSKGAKEWWEKLQPSKNGEGRGSGGDRAALARLRRCSTWVEAAAEPETALLFRQIGGGDAKRLPRVAALAAVLAHVRSDEASNLASSVGSKGGDDEAAVLSPLRLRRLLTTQGDDAILTAFRRLIALKHSTVNVADLARLVLYWEDERTRMKFAFDYWQAGPAAPEDEAPKHVSANSANA